MHEAEAIVLKGRSPVGLKSAFLGRFSVLCPLSPMLQRRAERAICQLLEILHEPKRKYLVYYQERKPWMPRESF